MIKASWLLFWMCVLMTVNQFGFGGIMPALPLYAQSFGASSGA
jgi:DHA1 family multidrug resistance protein-like MFS transporter